MLQAVWFVLVSNDPVESFLLASSDSDAHLTASTPVFQAAGTPKCRAAQMSSTAVIFANLYHLVRSGWLPINWKLVHNALRSSNGSTIQLFPLHAHALISVLTVLSVCSRN
jgi:hypothetical protein